MPSVRELLSLGLMIMHSATTRANPPQTEPAAEGAAPAETHAQASIELLARRGASGLQAAMALTPAWRWPQAPALDQVPNRLWADYAAWLFAPAAAEAEAAGRPEAYAAQWLRRMEELIRWADRNCGSAAVRGALVSYLERSPGSGLRLRGALAKRRAELHARLLLRALGRGDDRYEVAPSHRRGRRLRVGFVARNFGTGDARPGILPLFEHLDPDQFETVLHAFDAPGGPAEEHCRERAAEFHLLPADLDAQVSALRAGLLDVLVFDTIEAGSTDELARLALHRLAPLQVVNGSLGATTGFSAIDLRISAAADCDSAHFTERLGHLPGPSQAFDAEAGLQEATVFPDTLAASDAIGDLIETAYDALLESGPAAFRADRTPLRAAAGPDDPQTALEAGERALSQGNADEALDRARAVLRAVPGDKAARHLLGRALIALGRPGRAADYLRAAADTSGGDAAVYFDLARALRTKGNVLSALDALETSLRLNAACAPAWAMISELAEAMDSKDLAREAKDLAQRFGAQEGGAAALPERVSAA